MSRLPSVFSLAVELITGPAERCFVCGRRVDETAPLLREDRIHYECSFFLPVESARDRRAA